MAKNQHSGDVFLTQQNAGESTGRTVGLQLIAARRDCHAAGERNILITNECMQIQF